MTLHIEEASSLNQFLDASARILPPGIFNEEQLAWYWDHNYYPKDLLSIAHQPQMSLAI